MPPVSENIALRARTNTVAMMEMKTAPITQAQTAPGPASWAVRQAPKSQPEPMIPPSPVMVREIRPMSRRTLEAGKGALEGLTEKSVQRTV